MTTKKRQIEDYFAISKKLVHVDTLCNRYNISKSYLYSILRELIKEGLIARVPGKRIYYIRKNSL